MIRLENVNKIYQDGGMPVKAVEGVTLEVVVKDFMLLTGRSGSGKTTLLSLIGGLTRPTSGKIFFKDADIWNLDDKKLSRLRNKKIGFIFQFASLVPTLNVRDNLNLPTIFHKVDFNADKRCEDLLETVNLSHKINAYPSQLSGGEQRRVALARALMNNPNVLLADEPTGDLDEETENEVMDVLHRLNKSGMTIILVTHNMKLEKYATKHLKISHGKIDLI
ncbi:ABC transporter ATP-binding protein [Thermoproteota archaeon]